MAKKKRMVKRGNKGSKRLSRKPINKMRLAIRNLVLFAALCLASFIGYGLTDNIMFENFFKIMCIIFGALGVAFLIVIVVLLLLKAFRK
jgi:hypothetical protein